jgi:hypothetical protein
MPFFPIPDWTALRQDNEDFQAREGADHVASADFLVQPLRALLDQISELVTSMPRISRHPSARRDAEGRGMPTMYMWQGPGHYRSGRQLPEAIA